MTQQSLDGRERQSKWKRLSPQFGVVVLSIIKSILESNDITADVQPALHLVAIGLKVQSEEVESAINRHGCVL